MVDQDKFQKSIETLKQALKYEKKSLHDDVFAAAIAKCFESCFEYAWKILKQKVIEHGLEAYSPREAIKSAGQLGLINNVEAWLEFLEDRNLSVHDYIGVHEEEYLKTIKSFLQAVQKLNLDDK
jgi:nucleotidyltransferase substrate binding protein (TIGR01987 family)